ncbi:MAG: hypothetical protein ACC707_15615 [Thiohalomonadales bacterium]
MTRFMGNNCWVVNSSPLILLVKIGYVHLIADLANRVIVPTAVKNEIGVKEDGKTILELLRDDKRFLFEDDEDVHTALLAWDLGLGETQAINTAMRKDAERVVLDDMEARRCAKVMGLSVIGILGLVARAKQLGYIEQAAPIIELCVRPACM